MEVKCPVCGKEVEKKVDVIKEDKVEYEYYKCRACGEEFLNMPQLERVAQKYRELKRAKKVTFAKWGNSIGVRIPRELTSELKIKSGVRGLVLKEKNGIRIVLD